MLDRYFVKNNTPKDVFTRQYKPEHAITRRRFVNESGRNLHVIFPPWHGGGQLYERLIDGLARKGDAVLAYYFHDEILKPNTELVRASYAHMRDTISAELTHTVEKRSYAKVRLIGMSIGNTVLATTTSKFPAFDSAVLVCTASSLARSMWDGTRTQHVRAGIEQSGQDLAYVENAWHDAAPATHIGALAGKDVRILVSNRDDIIPTRYQMEFVQAAQEAGVNPNVQTTRVGHYAAIGGFCLNGKV
ncbi:hypothetical protein IPL85_02970 [Candidatus Saccharibacteria bacterium]|nr:MAG: hypothetical protein IPL85_02970 [Candidatus Saccharibacteria bacterium]